MRCLLQRVSQGAVSVDGEVIGETGPGLVVLACAMQGDTQTNVQAMAKKLTALRIFKDENGRMNRSLLDTGGGVLVISQFTLAADTKSGNRPGFSAAAPPEESERLYELLCATLSDMGITVGKGRFGADMQVSLVNDGPVTIWLEK
ncbi:D-aminoacyl-tRNA deacylase [Neptunicoccus cionae]|uniref:D-aminoacyl-tRNA deacylase n=1 Tax=Neptunicoccus cionae TaxID=2035344 RepID=A0A916QUM3_9RHOB|nr:D-aminoacyl-tRNA deacylase [Amylibacter cionae]GGA14711.1 D-aminoacyl-tRNA deacylase [Amylibacter cionae]